MTKKRSGCGGKAKCGGAPWHYWLGIWWLGRPKPLRWWDALCGRTEVYYGCGCVVFLRWHWRSFTAAQGRFRAFRKKHLATSPHVPPRIMRKREAAS